MTENNELHFNPKMSTASEKVFTRYHLISAVVLLVAIFAAVLMAG